MASRRNFVRLGLATLIAARAAKLTPADLALNTPYNTYMHAGLPIGPISNPGDAAIQAILHPDTGDLLYFLTVSGGKSEFSPNPLQGQ